MVFKRSMKAFFENSLLNGANGTYLEDLYERYLSNPAEVSKEWVSYFQSLQPHSTPQGPIEVPHSPIREYFRSLAKFPGVRSSDPAERTILSAPSQAAVASLREAYRSFGHCVAKLDPLDLQKRPLHPRLNLAQHGFSPADPHDPQKTYLTYGLLRQERAPLEAIVQRLEAIYCGHVGYEYQHMTAAEEVSWLQARIEDPQAADLPLEVRQSILQHLTAAEGIERYLHTKYVGQKRFSLEGGESFIVIMNELIQRAGGYGFQEIVIAMAHRGRLNVLVNTLGKAPKDLFAEFEGKKKTTLMSGDVKYHQGFSSDVMTHRGPVHLALAFNPSHLEIVSPVAQGSVRARQDKRKRLNTPEPASEVLSIVAHGDAAFSGQGVVMETFNMAHTRGFGVGGTIHIVINNQVGFTTSELEDARSTPYCTDVAKMVEAPVFHVNGDDPEAVLHVTQLALDYRHRFQKDVVIDLVCYRRQGHNEADEPSGTQPLMYQVIKNLPTTRERYAQQLIKEGQITVEVEKQMIEAYRQCLDQGEIVLPQFRVAGLTPPASPWVAYASDSTDVPIQTAVDLAQLKRLGVVMNHCPAEYVLQAQVNRVLAARTEMLAGKQPLDWGCGELLAYASVLADGYNVRLCGQDSGRGTFSHRHAVLHDQKTGAVDIPLSHLSDLSDLSDVSDPAGAALKPAGQYVVIDSLLSEEAVLAFEYGYATTDPNTLVIWEAQFGDFANGAQVVIDQFISSGEHKWGRLCGLTLFLPHGYEGQGPEHSSARLERFLQLCADRNIQVCVPTTPAQIFHLIRRQVRQLVRKPLIVFTPKSLLRHKLAVSSLEDLSTSESRSSAFGLLIPETEAQDTRTVRRVVLCSGKVYYDLFGLRASLGMTDVAIVRIEQLYPFPHVDLRALLASYIGATEVVWCQEEPMNQGAWYCTQHRLREALAPHQALHYVGRPASSSPAVGYHALHQEQQEALVQSAILNKMLDMV
jgi:2-oxoglutarate dehydrogenase E1 component